MIIQLLREALEARYLLLFDYDDKQRLVEPHALGLNKKGDTLLRAWQTGDDGGWKLFNLGKVDNIEIVVAESLAPRPGYKAGDTAMTEIFAELPQPQLELEAAA